MPSSQAFWLLAALALACFVRVGHGESRLTGWLGEKNMRGSSGGGGNEPPIVPWRGVDPSSVDVISLGQKLRAFLYRGLLTDAECDHIIDKAPRYLAPSGVVNSDTGGSDTSNIRTSSGTFLMRQMTPTVAHVERKFAEFANIPEENGEGLQILRYEVGQKYDPHYDYFFHEGGIQDGGNRLATVLAYLSDPDAGGETVFPNVPAAADAPAGLSPCGKTGLAVRPRKGDALLFWSLKVGGELDRGSMHTGCPVVAGTKYHVAEYGKGRRVEHVVFKTPPKPSRGDCTKPDSPTCCRDSDLERCPGWAEDGECKKNPGFMVGDAAGFGGACRLSCDDCPEPPSPRGDAAGAVGGVPALVSAVKEGE